MKRILIITSALAALTACSAAGTSSYDRVFGDAVTNNSQIHAGEKDFIINLANRFAGEVQSTVNFAFNSSQLDAEAQNVLRQQARWISQFPEVRFRVYGHTDAVGSDAYNKRLGKRRADAAVNFLVSQGISRSRLEAVASFGETQPLIVTQGRERRNRRTVTEVSGFDRSNQIILDGKYAEVIYREYVESATAPTSLSNVSESDSFAGDGG